MKRGGPIARRTPLARGGRIKPKKRTASEFNRIYGSKARVAWVKMQRCAVAGPLRLCRGDVENAHTETGGIGRKADYDTIIPLCRGHHQTLHDHGARSFEHLYRLSLSDCAEGVEGEWKTLQEARSAGTSPAFPNGRSSP